MDGVVEVTMWSTKVQRALSEAQSSLIEAFKAELAAKDRQIAAHEGLLLEMRRIIATQEDTIETLTERCAALKDNGEPK